MSKLLVLLVALYLIVEKIAEKILHIIPNNNRNGIFLWFVSTILGLIIAFSFRVGFIRELGLITGSKLSQPINYFLN